MISSFLARASAVTAGRSLQGTPEQIAIYHQLTKLTDQMDKLEKHSPEYTKLQKQLWALMQKSKALDPTGAGIPFHYGAWTHSSPPPGKRGPRGLLK